MTEEKDKLKARVQQMEKDMADSTVNASKVLFLYTCIKIVF